MTETVHIRVRGRVQGVGFRAFTVAIANRHGVVGWVRNSPNASEVEIIARGEPDSIHEFSELVRQGPPNGRVEHVECHAINLNEEFAGFGVRY